MLQEISVPMPVLQRLSIKAIGSQDFVLAPEIFAGSTPALQILSLSCCTLPSPYMLPFMQGARLTELRLLYVRFHWMGPDTKIRMLEFLNQQHDLEIFEWAEAYGSGFDPSPHERPTQAVKSVHWPKLRTLEIRSTCILAARFLQQLQIPESSQATITCVSNHHHISVSNYLKMLEALRGIYPDVTTAPFAADRKASRRLTLRALDGASAGGLLMLDLAGGVASPDMQPLLSPLHCEEAFLHLASSSVTHKSDKMSLLLGALNKTRHLRLRCGKDSRAPMDTLCAMLSERCTVLPRLEKLSLHDMTIGTGTENMSLWALRRIVRERAPCHGVLEHIIFVNCTRGDADECNSARLREIEALVKISWVDV